VAEFAGRLCPVAADGATSAGAAATVGPLSAELNAEKERVETTLNAIGDAVITIDLSGQLRYLNAVAQHLLWRPAGVGPLF
jgi:PAS domain-containing protein